LALIDGPALAEFLDTHKNQSIPLETVRDVVLLKKLGINIARKPERKTIEAFLLRSSLYQIDASKPDSLTPYLIVNNWSDYAKSWKIHIDNNELHIPFTGKIAFLCANEGSKMWVCHPQSSAFVDKIYVELGELTFPHHELGFFKKETCVHLLQNFRLDTLTPSTLEEIKKNTGFAPDSFLTALIGLKLAVKKDDSYLLSGESPSGEALFFTELEKIQGDTDLEKAARLLLRRDHQYYMHISTTLAWLESQERVIEPYLSPVGKGRKEKAQMKKIVDCTSLNIRVIANVVREYSQFGSFLEWYPREYFDPELLKWTREYYCFLSCHMDSLGFLAASFNIDRFPVRFFKTDTKQEKFKRHLEYLLKFISRDNFLFKMNARQMSSFKEKLDRSEFIDFNPNSEVLKSVMDTAVDAAWCPYNVFVISKVPVKANVFKEKVLQTLKSESVFKDPQGHFFYPDFRFLLSSELGLSFHSFDNVLAYILSKDIDFRSRLWLPVTFGIKIKKHRIEDTLLSVVGEPFDSISLRY
jgi:hypothetical protein